MNKDILIRQNMELIERANEVEVLENIKIEKDELERVTLMAELKGEY